MDGKLSLVAEASVEIQLDELASLTRQVIVFIDALPRTSIAALEAAGWHSGHAFSLRADLARAAECAARARSGAAQASSAQ
jgi:hypothetical protein